MIAEVRGISVISEIRQKENILESLITSLSIYFIMGLFRFGLYNFSLKKSPKCDIAFGLNQKRLVPNPNILHPSLDCGQS